MRTRLALLGAALALVAAACGPATDGDEPVAGAPLEPTGTPTPADEDEPPPWPWELELAGEDVPATVPLSEIRSGGPPPDGIPPIDDPVFESVGEAAGWLEPRDPVLVAERSGEARAYPLAILTFHEIVNDTLAGQPTLVTYCPLCNSGLVFDPTVDGEVLSFGTSGRLWKSNLVMYDRSTRSLWSQFTGEAIVGERLGQRLERLPMQMVAFGEFADTWPDAVVLSRDTGHNRPYGQNPYGGYDSSERPFLFDGDTGGPLPQMARVVTVGEDDPAAVPLEVLFERRVVELDADGEDLVALWSPGTASALDTADISQGADVGATGVFRPIADGTALSFEPQGERRFTDRETGSTWTVLGHAVEGPLEGARLERVPHDDTFWFVQFAFRPETRVVDGG